MPAESVYLAPLPLGRKAALELLSRLDEFDTTSGAFLTFVQIPLKERIGEWRYAGASDSLAQAVRRVEEFVAVMRQSAPALPNDLLRQLLNDTGGCEADEFMYPRDSPRAVSGPHRVVLCIQYGAPYEGLGAGIVEVESLTGSSFAGVAPETYRRRSGKARTRRNEPDKWDR